MLERELVDADVHLAPEDLVEARLGADGVALEHLGDGHVGVQPVALGLHPHVGDRVAQRGVGRIGVLASRAATRRSAVALKRAGLRRLTPRSKPAVAIATRQPWFDLAERVLDRHAHVVEEDLGEAGVAVELRDRTHGHARASRAGRG